MILNAACAWVAGVGSDCTSGAGSVTGSAVPSIKFAASLARAASYFAQRIESRVNLLIGRRGSRERHSSAVPSIRFAASAFLRFLLR